MPPPRGDAYTAALKLLARRELAASQLRDRLRRRAFGADAIEEAIARLVAEGALDDRRVALSRARTQSLVRRRGRRRVQREVEQLGVGRAVARAAVDAVFQEIDERELLEPAITRRLRGRPAAALDARALARIVRALVRQGFDADHVLARLHARGARGDG